MKAAMYKVSAITLAEFFLLLLTLNWILILQYFHSSFHYTLLVIQNILLCMWTVLSQSTNSSHTRLPALKLCIGGNIDDQQPKGVEIAQDKLKTESQGTTGEHQELCFHENLSSEKLTIQEVRMLIEKRGTSCEPGSREIKEMLGSGEIAVLFEEQEPSLEEVKEAFHVFDEDNKGFIDARNLNNVLHTLGFTQVSEVECKTMIRAFDKNGDGRIDFNEFIKLAEMSFS